MTARKIDAKTVAKWYMAGLWTAEMCTDAKNKGYINQSTLDKILKLPVKGQT